MNNISGREFYKLELRSFFCKITLMRFVEKQKPEQVFDETRRGEVIKPNYSHEKPSLVDNTAGAPISRLSWEARRNIALGTIALAVVTCGILANIK